ncbi:AAA family ATPase [Hymenobacter terrenus]|uniref:AAA family ATPase n=1 Tax=Hymenobacter terrenus TaxID=1629124 RepID=UPI0006192D7B|nr:AAA family ATPase [Hymenobacter terrenus]
MLKRLHLKNFTVFADADFEFVQGLNVIVGTNGTGKTHVLKLGYALLRSLTSRVHNGGDINLDSPLTSLKEIFRPTPADVAELIRRQANPAQAAVLYELDDERLSPGLLNFSPDISAEHRIVLNPPSAAAEIGRANAAPVFIPAKEILTLGWMRPASKQLRLPIDETYLDLLNQLDNLPLKQPETTDVLMQLNEVIGGEVESDGSRFYVSFAKEKSMDVSMVAEGLRKFGTLQRLLNNGSLTKQSTLFWDEPEANLNPALLRKLAAILAELARQGFQIILATHSMSLLKEFHILSREKDKVKLPLQYFGLNAEPGQPTTVITKDDFEYLPDVVALEVELKQADALEEVFIQDDQKANADRR